METQINREFSKMLFTSSVAILCRHPLEVLLHTLIVALFYGRIIKTVYNTLLDGSGGGGKSHERAPMCGCVASMGDPVKLFRSHVFHKMYVNLSVVYTTYTQHT